MKERLTESELEEMALTDTGCSYGGCRIYEGEKEAYLIRREKGYYQIEFKYPLHKR